MVLWGDEAQVEAHFSPFGDRANLDTRWMYGLRRTYHRLENHFGRTWWNSWVTRLKTNLVLVRLVTVLVSVQGRCTVCTKCTIVSEIILDETDRTPRWRGSCGCSFRYFWRYHFGAFGNGVSVSAREVHGLSYVHSRLSNHFGRTRWYSEVTRLKWKLISVHLEIELILTQDGCMVCAGRTIGLKIILDAPDGTPRWQGSRRILFWSVWWQR
jgi:hypothetical protein